jgi:hypothetical protein
MVSLTLAPEEIAILDRVSEARGVSKSSLVGQLLRAIPGATKGKRSKS